MATVKAKKSAAPRARTAKPEANKAKARPPAASKAAAGAPTAPNRKRAIQVLARLSADEKRDLDDVVAHWEAAAAAQGFAGKGFADWLRAIIRREKRAAGL